MGQNTQITSADGFTLGAYEASPEGTPKGAVVVIQEIFGVNIHIREVVDGYAADGYYAIAPQIFDRIEPNIELGYEDKDMEAGIGLAFEKLDHGKALEDVQAAINTASAQGKVGKHDQAGPVDCRRSHGKGEYLSGRNTGSTKKSPAITENQTGGLSRTRVRVAGR